MALFFSPDGTLNVAADPSDLPEQSGEGGTTSGAMVRCKNLRLDEPGKAKTRDGSAKLHDTALESGVNWLEVQGEMRYAFSGTQIYENEVSIESGLTADDWCAIQYNAYNDATPNVFALNGTDRKRIEDGAVQEWGIAAPTAAPTLSAGIGNGLTGEYNAVYTYVRKVGSVVVAESNPSPAADATVVLADQSLAALVEQPTDAQITHIRLYRTQDGGESYFLDSEISASTAYAYGYMHDWEESEGYVVGNGYHFTTTSSVVISDGTGSSSSGGSTPSGLVAISDQTVYTLEAYPATATAGYRLASTGIAYHTNPSGTYVAIGGEWLLSGSASAYEVQATLVSGTTPSGTLGSWLGLGTTRTWTLASSDGYLTCTLLIEIRNATTLAVLDTATVVIQAESYL
jgi:hypothetical protein